MSDRTPEELEAIKKSGLFFVGLDKLVRGIKLYEGKGSLVEQLLKDREMDMFSFSKVIARVLKTYIEDGTLPGKTVCENCGAEGTLVYQEGCVTCTSCGHGKCG